MAKTGGLGEHKGSILAMLERPGNEKMKHAYLRNKAVFAANRLAMEAWYKNGCASQGNEISLEKEAEL